MYDSQTSDQDRNEPREGGVEYVTRPRFVPFHNRPVHFLNPVEVESWTGHGHTYVTGKPPIHSHIVDLMSRRPDVAALYLEGHYPIVKHDGGGSLTWSGQWFGDDATTEDCGAVWGWLGDRVERYWRGGGLMLTPATTGRDLWLRTVRHDGYPVLPQDLQNLIRHTSGQGRIEAFPLWELGAAARALPTTPGTAHLYDSRLAYLGVTRAMPVGIPAMVGPDAAEQLFREDPYRAARWDVSWLAPGNWTHVGILPAKGEETWEWPLTGRGWADGSEVAIALKHGWMVHFHQGLVFPERVDIFRTWQDRLLKILGDAATKFGVHAIGYRMVRHAVRAMVLHTIGAFHGRPHKVTGVGEDPPEGAYQIRALSDGRFVWAVDRPPAWPQMSHPEWTAAIWGRARARLLDANGVGALHLPAGSVLGFRTDAILTTCRTGWDDDGRVGAYRLQGTAPLTTWPRTNTDVLNLKRTCEL